MSPTAPAVPVSRRYSAGTAGTTNHPHSNLRKGAPPVLRRLARLWADTHLADDNRQLTYDRSYLTGELERVTGERDDALRELEQWRHGSPRLAALHDARRSW